jgi:uncharacterized FlaG/YvyC family protein
MPGNSVAAIQGIGSAGIAASAGPVATTEERALNRSVSAAVQTVNESQVLGADRSVTFSFDQATRLPVVKVLDTSTNQVVEQWPPEYILQLAADARKSTRDSG